MHHWSDNLFFGRQTDGSVRVIKFRTPPQSWPKAEDPHYPDALIDLTIPGPQWCSILAAVSRRSGDADAFMDATTLHNAAPHIRHHQVGLHDSTTTKDRIS